MSTAPTTWTWRDEGDPPAAGWYATVHCWDLQEGMFPGAHSWDGSRWPERRPVIAWAGPFANEATATEWAEAHDPEPEDLPSAGPHG